MTQFPHDEFVKEYIPELIGEYGLVNGGETVHSEIKEIDVFFIPQKPIPTTPETLGLLGKLAQTTCLFEVFRNPVETHQIQECLGKLFDVQNKQRREKRKNKEKILPKEIPFLWILTPTFANHKLEQFSAKLDLNNYENGVYLLPPSLQTGIIIIHQLPVNKETLWLRMLGRGSIQEKAIEELKNLPVNHPHRDNIIELVLNLLAMLESNQKQGNNLPSEDRELIMKLSPVYLERLAENKQLGIEEGLQQGLNQGLEIGQKNMIEGILINRFGSIDDQLKAIIPQLLKSSSMEIVPLLLNLSRQDLIDHFLENELKQ